MNTTISTIKEQIAQLEVTIEALQIEKIKLETQLHIEEALDVATKQEEPVPTPRAKGSARVKKSTKQPTKRDINAGDKARIDEAKQVAQSVKPLKVEQEKRTTKKPSAEKAKKQPKREYNGMTYAQLRSEVSTRQAKLNKADPERMSTARLKH